MGCKCNCENNSEITKLIDLFSSIFGNGGEINVFHSPGRVNLIGEHTDYNAGYVFPCALSFGTYGVVRLRNDKTINFASTNFDLKVSADIENLFYKKEDDWANYLKGVIVEFQSLGFADKLSGFDILLSGNIPNGAGLSSSASIELLMSVVLNDLFNCGLSMIEMVKLSQHAENTFIGVNCGIMDQFAVGMGKKDNAIFLDCAKIEHKYVPLELGNNKIVIANTNKRRGLADSKYNERRSECEKSVEYLKKELQLNFLGDISKEQFEEHKYLITDPIVLKRAEHVIYENARVLEAVEKLQSGDIAGFGLLMNQSHDSLRDLYEVTGIELDSLVEEARKIDGTLGSRMTGAGFGGCTVSIVRADAVDNFIKTVGEAYKNRVGLTADFYVADVGNGAEKIK